MAYCGPRGIPHSHFLGGPALWTQADRDKALAWQERQRQHCPGCSTRPADWDPAQGGSHDAWEFAIDICPGCERKDRAVERMNGNDYKGVRGKQLRVRRPKADDEKTGASE